MKAKKNVFGLILIVMIVLSGCANKPIAPISFNEDDAVYRLAWQYILADSATSQMTNAKITRLELMDSIKQDVSVYSLEYSIYESRQSGWCPGDSVYLYVRSNDGIAELIETKDIKESVQMKETAEELDAFESNAWKIDVSKPSDEPKLFLTNEIEEAINTAREYQERNGHFVINLWYDNEVFQSLIEAYAENSLYGMDAAAQRGDLIILNSDIYFDEDDKGVLGLNWKIILMRDGKDENWEVVDQGY